MQSRIGHVHVRYRVPRGSPSAAAAIPALERIVRERIAATCERAFDDAFRDDPTVYVVRRIEARVAVSTAGVELEARTAEQWGQRLCAAVAQTIAADDRDRVVKFEDPAAFAVSFLNDFVAGLAWDRWFYGRFAPLRSLEDGEVILAVLADHREDIWTVLARLRRAGTLDEVLRRLDPAGQRQLWRDIAHGDRTGESAEALRIFVRAAMTAADALDIWMAAPPELATLLDDYVRTRPAAPEWTNASSLADAVADVIRWLAERRLVDPSKAPDEMRPRIEGAGAALEWLDTGRLAERIKTLGLKARSPATRTATVLRPPTLTPSQQRLLEILRAAVAQGTSGLRPADLTEANLLRLAAALAEQHGAASAYGLALVEHIVGAWQAIATLPTGGDVLRALRRGDLDDALAKAARPSEGVADHFGAVVRGGAPAVDLVEALVECARASDTTPLTWVETGAAGLFLLVRAIQDTRLPALAVSHGLPSVHPLLSALALCLGGAAARLEDGLDPGAAAWAGIDPSAPLLTTLEPLNRVDAGAFLAELTQLLEAQGTLDPDERVSPLVNDESIPASAATVDVASRVGASLLRAWGRWLPGLGRSSAPYLLTQFIRRRGAFSIGNGIIDVRLEPAPLDQVLRMAGYLADTPPARWLGGRVVRFHHGTCR